MRRQSATVDHLSDSDLFARITQLAQDLQTTISREGWTDPSIGPIVDALEKAVHEAGARLMLHQEAARDQLCQQRFGRLSDDELVARIAHLEQELMSAMEVSGPPELAVNTIAEQLRCACLVASKRPSLWARVVAEGHCKGPVTQQRQPQT